MFLVQCEEFKNQPSNSTSCSDNALCLLVLVTCILYWGFQVTSLFSIWGCVLKGCFERGIFWRARSRLKGIEDFNLEHWSQVCHPGLSSVQFITTPPNYNTCSMWNLPVVHPGDPMLALGKDAFISNIGHYTKLSMVRALDMRRD